MNKELLNNLASYIEQLPPKVQVFVFSGDWLEKTNQIATKYSLTETQSESLSDIVLFILIGLEKPENLLTAIVSELNISELLAEQIIEDINNRIFDVAIQKTTEENDNIEIRPEILPMVEGGEKVKVVPPPVNLPTEPEISKPQNKPAPFVPSFTAVKQSPTQPTPIVQRPNIATMPTPPKPPIQPIVPPEVKKPEAPKTPEVAQPINAELKKYGIDPYREPLE
jgi:hypothetical protein